MKRKKRTSSLKSSSEQLVKEETYLYLPDECWEPIFRFIINEDDQKINNRNLNSLSLVSKQFLSITNCLLFSLTIVKKKLPFLHSLFQRFTNLNSLDLSHCRCCSDLNSMLRKISCFPLNITSLNISCRETIPLNGLQVFSQKVKTLTSLNCSNMHLKNKNELLFIANCFPLLKELNLGNSLISNHNTEFINGIHSLLLSKFRGIQHLDLHHTWFVNDQQVSELSLELRDLVSINLSQCGNLTESAFFSLVRNCPALSDINMGYTRIGKEREDNSNSFRDFAVSPQLKSLCLAGCYHMREENIILFASIFPNLEVLDLTSWRGISEASIYQVLRCCKIKHLNLSHCQVGFLGGMNFKPPNLEVLDLSYTKVDDQSLSMISKSCCGLSQLLLKNCHDVTENGVKHVVNNCTKLREINLRYCYKVQTNDIALMIVLRPSLRKITAPSLKMRKRFLRYGCLVC